MRSPDSEQLEVGLGAPGGEDAQVGGLAASGGAAVAGQEAGNGGAGLSGVVDKDDVGCRGHGAFPPCRPQMGRQEENAMDSGGVPGGVGVYAETGRYRAHLLVPIPGGLMLFSITGRGAPRRRRAWPLPAHGVWVVSPYHGDVQVVSQ